MGKTTSSTRSRNSHLAPVAEADATESDRTLDLCTLPSIRVAVRLSAELRQTSRHLDYERRQRGQLTQP